MAQAVTGFGKLDPNVLVNTAHLVAKGVGGNPVYFPNLPIDPAALECVGEHTVRSGYGHDGCATDVGNLPAKILISCD
jgi:hypothetical protein